MQSIVKSSNPIRKFLKQRFKELNLTLDQICADGTRHKQKIFKPQLSRYLSGSNDVKYGIISEQIIVFLCCRYCINIKLKVTKLPYSEESALENVKKYF